MNYRSRMRVVVVKDMGERAVVKGLIGRGDGARMADRRGTAWSGMLQQGLGGCRA